jgi:tRNA threonylcarbamoyladenosine biosynthesis protein TsaE
VFTGLPSRSAYGNPDMVKEFEIITSSEEETISLGATMGAMLRPGDLILLIGELGAGKTRLAKGIVSAATGIDPEEVVSPTFTLINCFEGPFQVCHADLYRIDSQQIEGIGLEDALDDGAALIVEWAEKILDLDEDPLRIYIRYYEEENRRQFRLEWSEGGAWDIRMTNNIKQFVI